MYIYMYIYTRIYICIHTFDCVWCAGRGCTRTASAPKRRWARAPSSS